MKARRRMWLVGWRWGKLFNYAIRKGRTMDKPVDFSVTATGSLALIRPESPAAEQWIEANVQAGAYWWKGCIVAELRYAGDIVEAMTAAGLEGGKAASDRDQTSPEPL